jgi:hypothetical protein
MAKRMTRMAAAATLAPACLVPFLLCGCSSSETRTARAEADRSAPVAVRSSNVQRYRIRDWTAIDDHTLIIVTQDGTRYRAETLGPCNGLGFATSVAFVNRGGFGQIDRTSSVVLPDGTRCPFQTFDQIRSPESKALDSYEKAGESKPAQDSSGQSSSGQDSSGNNAPQDESKPK